MDLSFERFQVVLTLAVATSVVACDKPEVKADPAAQSVAPSAQALVGAPSVAVPIAKPEHVAAPAAKPSTSTAAATPVKAAAATSGDKDSVTREKSCGGEKGCGGKK